MYQATHGGEVNVAISQGLMQESDIAGTLPDVVNGTTAGRTFAGQITVFDSTGLAIQDIAVAIVAYERALEAGIGSTIEL
jgi:alanine dehydrogenase